MSHTYFKQWRFPLTQGAGGHAFGIRINKGIVAGATGPQRYSGSIYAAWQIIQLDPNFLPLSIGEWERTRHDIGGVPAVPKIELTFQDMIAFSGVSNGIPVSFNLSSVYSSLLDELFDDPTIVYEVWLDDYLNGSLFEIWFVGDVDYGTIPILHKGVAGEGTSTVTRYQEYTITANFMIERLVADHNKDTADPYTGGIVTPGSIFHFAYGYRTGATLPVWNGPAPVSGNSPSHFPIYPGSASSWANGNTFYGLTGDASSGTVVGYVWPYRAANIISWSLDDLAYLLADYAGMIAYIDSPQMFDYYAQSYKSSTGRFSNLAQIYGTDFLYVNMNFLLGNGIPITGSFDPIGHVLLQQTSGYAGGNFNIQGSFYFYDTNSDVYDGGGSVYLQCSNSGGIVTCYANNDTFSGLHTVNGDNLTLTGTATTVATGVQLIQVSGAFAGSNVSLVGYANSTGSSYTALGGSPLSGTVVKANSVILRGASPILYQWPNTIAMDADVLTLAAWIATQTGTWIDSSIDATGNVTMYFRNRRPQQGATPFAFKHLSFNTATPDPLIISSNEDPSEVTQTSVIVQCLGNGVQMMAGKDSQNAVNITLPFQCHKQGEYTAGDGKAFYNPNNVTALCIEQWWNQSLTSYGDAFLHQAFAATCDAKISRPDPNYSPGDAFGENDLRWVSNNAIPTSDGWSGASTLLWLSAHVDRIFPVGAYNELNPPGWQGRGYSAQQTPNIAGDGFVGIAAILPAGLAVPTDEFCGGYFNPQTAAAQFYYQEIVGCNGEKLVLVQDYIGCRGDDGYMQSLRPGIIFTTLLRGKMRTLVLHNVKIRATENSCTLQWEEVPTDRGGNFQYNSMLPDVMRVGSGSGGMGVTGGAGSPVGGGSGSGSSPMSVWSTTSNTLGANTDNLALTLATPNVYLRLSATAAYGLTGIVPILNCFLLVLTNTGTNQITITHEDPASAAANQFLLQFGGPLILQQDATYTFFYDTIAQKWRQQ